MINQQLTDFIKQQLQKGVSREVILKELLGSDWTVQDIEEGFNAIDVSVPVSDPTSTPITNLVSELSPISTLIPNLQTTPNISMTSVEAKSHTSRNVILIVLVLFLLAGGVFGYLFRNDLPIIKDLIENKDMITEPQVQPEPSTPTPTPTVTEKENTPNLPAVQPITSDTIECGNDLTCFINAANNCQKSKLSFTVKDKPLFNMGMLDTVTSYWIEGKVKNNCIAGIKILDYKLKYSPEIISSMIKGGQTQVDIDKVENDLSKSMAGNTQTCKLDLSKKMGDILNKDIINFTEIDTKCETTFTKSICTNASGLICEQDVVGTYQ